MTNLDVTARPFAVDQTFAGANADVLTRLIAILPGFVYRCRPDSARTMEFVSERCRDVLGYDPHRFIGQQSLSYGLLIHPDDRARVDAHIFAAARGGRRFTCCYRILAAYGRTVDVIDRGAGVLDEAGALGAIEGYVFATRERPAESAHPPKPDLGDLKGRHIEGQLNASGFSPVAGDDVTSELLGHYLPADSSPPGRRRRSAP